MSALVRTAAPTVAVDDDGVVFPSADEPPCDVLFDGRRVLSLTASRGALCGMSAVRCRWPQALRPYLKGVTQVTVTESASRAVRFEGEIRFGDSDARVTVATENGSPLAVSKWGWLGRAFDDSADAGTLVALTQRLLRDLNDIAGVPAYAAYGTLLGAVRSGKVIGHDFDTDISYLSPYSHPADIARESFRVQRVLRERGWKVDRGRHGKLVVKQLRNIDIFVSYFVGDRYYLDMWVEGPLRRDQILPLGTVTMEGLELPAPADPEALLELNFGPGWRQPDPTFKYDGKAPRLTRSRGWFGTHTSDKMPWTAFWRAVADPDGQKPSPFARWVGKRVDPSRPLLDIGCGTGADALYFASLGIPTTGYDFANRALERGELAAATLDTTPPRFVCLTLGDTRATLGEGARLAGEPGGKSVYARLIMDALPAEGYENFWRLLRMSMSRGGTAYLEFRSGSEVPLCNSRPGLWKRVPELADVRRRIAKAGGRVVEVKSVPASTTPTRVAMRRVVAEWPSD